MFISNMAKCPRCAGYIKLIEVNPEKQETTFTCIDCNLLIVVKEV